MEVRRDLREPSPCHVDQGRPFWPCFAAAARAHSACAVRFSGERREPHASHVNTWGAAGRFSGRFETFGCGGLGGTFEILTASVFRRFGIGWRFLEKLEGCFTTLLM